MEAAGRQDAAGRVTVGGGQVYRVLRDRAQGGRGGVNHRPHGALSLAQDLGEDAVADRRLAGQTTRYGRAVQMAAQVTQDRTFCLVAAEVVQGLVVGVQRSTERFDRQCEDRLGQAQAVPGVQGDVGGQGRGARRPVAYILPTGAPIHRDGTTDQVASMESRSAYVQLIVYEAASGDV